MSLQTGRGMCRSEKLHWQENKNLRSGLQRSVKPKFQLGPNTFPQPFSMQDPNFLPLS